jgi:hypothetical protein
VSQQSIKVCGCLKVCECRKWFVSLAGHRARIFYDGQPPTCYACNEIGHVVQRCPKRTHTLTQAGRAVPVTWAQVALSGTGEPEGPNLTKTTVAHSEQREQENQKVRNGQVEQDSKAR